MTRHVFNYVRGLSDIDKFFTKVQKGSEEECWPWLPSTTSSGYGLFCYRDENGNWTRKPAHVWHWEHEHGPVVKGMVLDHQCHNRDLSCPGGNKCPHRRCVNLGHLEPASHKTNILRGRGACARNAAKTHCPNGHPLEQISPTERRCLICKRENHRRYHQENREALLAKQRAWWAANRAKGVTPL